jgi:hypothetical protein
VERRKILVYYLFSIILFFYGRGFLYIKGTFISQQKEKEGGALCPKSMKGTENLAEEDFLGSLLQEP